MMESQNYNALDNRSDPALSWLDKQIIALYQTNTRRGAIKEFCLKHHIPRHRIYKIAIDLGVVSPRFREPPWSQKEIELVENHYHKTPAAIRAILQRRGFNRSSTAIVVKRKRLGLTMSGSDVYTASRLAGIMGVDRKVTARWIALGLLQARRRHSDRGESQGGDMYQITHDAIRRFIVENVALVDIRRIDKFWLVDLLVNGTK